MSKKQEVKETFRKELKQAISEYDSKMQDLRRQFKKAKEVYEAELVGAIQFVRRSQGIAEYMEFNREKMAFVSKSDEEEESDTA